MTSPNRKKSYGGAAIATTLSTGINASDTSITIAASTGWPTGGADPFVILIENEKILIQSRSGTTLTVASSGRGFDGTSAASHSSSVAVKCVMDAESIQQANNYITAQTAKGDMMVATGTDVTALPVGSNDQVMVADSAQTRGVKWAKVDTAQLADAGVTAVKLATDAVETAKIKDANVTTAKLAAAAVTPAKSAPAETRLRRVASQSIPATTMTDVTWDTEDADPDGYITVSSATLTVPTGKGGLHFITAEFVEGSGFGIQVQIIAGGITYLPNGGNFNCVGPIRLAQAATIKVSIYVPTNASVTGHLTVVRISD